MSNHLQTVALRFIPVCCLILLVACANETTKKSAATATLVVTTSIYPGNNTIDYAFTKDNKVTTAIVKRAYNSPTNHECYSGNLAPIYEAITTKSPENPSAYQTVDSILSTLEDHGWSVIKDTGRRVNEAPNPPQNLRTILLAQSPD